MSRHPKWKKPTTLKMQVWYYEVAVGLGNIASLLFAPHLGALARRFHAALADGSIKAMLTQPKKRKPKATKH